MVFGGVIFVRVFLLVDFILQGFTVAEVGGFRSIKYSICTGKSGTDVGFSGLKRCQRCDKGTYFRIKLLQNRVKVWQYSYKRRTI